MSEGLLVVLMSLQLPVDADGTLSRRTMRATLPLGMAGLLAGVIACAEAPTAAPAPVIPVGSIPALATLKGTVDLDRGTMEFSAVAPNALPGFLPAIYGDQNVNVRLYNSPVTLDSTTSTWRWTASVGVRNMRPHFTGDEETTAAPLDTMGVFVFFVQEPVLGQPCGGCFARIANYQGTLGFDAPNQKYFHWPERLNAMGSALGDTTRVRRTWIFETSAGARSFSFTVLVAAAWPLPFESRWKLQYTADVLPANASPVWKTESWAPGGSSSASGGSLTVIGNPGGLHMYLRRDPILPAQSAYVQATARLNSGAAARPEISLLLTDHVKLIAVGIANGTIGLMTNAGLFQAGTTLSLSSGAHQIQLRKYAGDSVVFFVDGTRRGRATYASLSADNVTGPSGAYVAFGALPTTGGNNSTWDDVIYEIGVALP